MEGCLSELRMRGEGVNTKRWIACTGPRLGLLAESKDIPVYRKKQVRQRQKGLVYKISNHTYIQRAAQNRNKREHPDSGVTLKPNYVDM